jgi:hypothetical protein
MFGGAITQRHATPFTAGFRLSGFDEAGKRRGVVCQNFSGDLFGHQLSPLLVHLIETLL